MNSRCCIAGLVWIVNTHTGDGHHVFRDVAEMLRYLHWLGGKPCTVAAVDALGNKVLSTDLSDER